MLLVSCLLAQSFTIRQESYPNSDKLTRQVNKLSNEVEVQKCQLERLRFSNDILKSQLKFKHREARVPKQPVLTEDMVTCTNSSPLPRKRRNWNSVFKEFESCGILLGNKLFASIR
jgi:hypothetical protein